MSENEEQEESLEYRLMFELEQLESLREDMEELGVKTLSEVEERINDLHARLDDLQRKV